MPSAPQSARGRPAWTDAAVSRALDVLATPLMLLALDGVQHAGSSISIYGVTNLAAGDFIIN